MLAAMPIGGNGLLDFGVVSGTDNGDKSFAPLDFLGDGTVTYGPTSAISSVPGRGRSARPDLRERWPARMVAQEAEEASGRRTLKLPAEFAQTIRSYDLRRFPRF
jgi:hypothetical protein